MVRYFLSLIENVFSKCGEWTYRLLNAIDGTGIVLAAFVLIIVVSMLFLPLRGSAISGFTDYTKNSMHKAIKRSGNKRGD